VVAVAALLAPPIETRELALRVLVAAAAPFAIVLGTIRVLERLVETSPDPLLEDPTGR
jgi:hypothetical protein